MLRAYLWRSRSRSFSPDSSDFGNSPIKSVRGRSPSPSKSAAWSPDRNSTSYLAVGNLTRNVNDGHLREIFGVYGEILAVAYPMHPNTGYPTGKAVIHYKEMVAVENALKGMHGGQIDGNVIECHASKYPEPLVKHLREPRRRDNRIVNGRIDHYAPSSRRNRSRTPVKRSRSPIRRFSPSRPPMRNGRRGSPRRASPRQYPSRRISRSPRRSSPVRRVSRSPKRFSRSPIRRDSRSSRRVSRSPPPRHFSRSPPRHFSRSPARLRSPSRRSPSPHYRRRQSVSRSPIRRRSPSYSRSPPSRYRRNEPTRQTNHSPRRDRSPSRSPIPVSRMNY